MYSVCQHPLINLRLPLMRDENCPMSAFRNHLHAISCLLVTDALANLPLQEETQLTTPTGAQVISYTPARPVVFIPILRAGLGMLDAAISILPEAEVGYLAMARDEQSLAANEFYAALPEANNPIVFILDPMLATGGSIIKALESLTAKGYQDIRVISLLAAPEGIKAIEKKYPNIQITLAALDDHLNEKGYILPGLGDAGDRLYGRK